MSEKFQAVVIGGGPGGYVCAIRLAQLGLKTACIESRGSLGGTCLNVGCIPSKSLLNLSEEFHKVQNLSSKGIEVGEVKLNLEKMMKSKDKAVTILTKGVEFLLKKNKVTYYKGTGSFKSQKEIIIRDDQNKETTIEAEKTVIATGSVPVSLPGIEIDEKVIVSSTGALKLDKVPNKMVVVGGGYIGLEMGSVWSRLGAEVQVVEFLDHITPGMDKEISSEFMKILKKQGIKFSMQNKVEAIQNNKSGAVVSTPAASRFKPLVFAFLPTEISATSQSKLFLFPSLSTVETTARDLLFSIASTLFCILNLMPCFFKIFINSDEISLSMPGVI